KVGRQDNGAFSFLSFDKAVEQGAFHTTPPEHFPLRASGGERGRERWERASRQAGARVGRPYSTSPRPSPPQRGGERVVVGVSARAITAPASRRRPAPSRRRPGPRTRRPRRRRRTRAGGACRRP